MEYAYKTNKALKNINEDNIIIDNVIYNDVFDYDDKSINLFGIADGVSSNKGGDICSFNLLQEFKNLKIFDLESIENTIINCQNKLNNKYKDNQNYKMMSSTLSLVYLNNNVFSLYNLGDSPIKIYNNGIYTISKIHTLENDLLNSGLIKDQSNVDKHIITKYFCLDKIFNGYYKENIELEKDSYILMCSDGLSDVVNDSIIENVIKSDATLKEKVNGLYEIALKRGSLDNISIILIRV